MVANKVIANLLLLQHFVSLFHGFGLEDNNLDIGTLSALNDVEPHIVAVILDLIWLCSLHRLRLFLLNDDRSNDEYVAILVLRQVDILLIDVLMAEQLVNHLDLRWLSILVVP
jgi:hypothetical protein